MRHNTLHWRTSKGLAKPYYYIEPRMGALDKAHIAIVVVAVAYVLYHVMRFEGWL